MSNHVDAEANQTTSNNGLTLEDLDIAILTEFPKVSLVVAVEEKLEDGSSCLVVQRLEGVNSTFLGKKDDVPDGLQKLIERSWSPDSHGGWHRLDNKGRWFRSPLAWICLRDHFLLDSFSI